MKKITLIFILITSISLKSNSQFISQVFDMPQVTPVTPNAAALSQFGQYPVGYYTGTPDIRIPLYEIDLDGLKIPICMKYNSSGIKVSQEASWVGLGWSLEAGGNITKEIRGGNDFGGNSAEDPGYYYTSTQWPDYDENNDIINLNYPFGIREQPIFGLTAKDTEPDLFHFNFGPYSGTMYFERDNPKPIIQTPTEYLDIIYNIGEESWIITDSYGYKFYFKTRDLTRVYDESTPLYDDAYFQGHKPLPERKKLHKVSTSWSLDSIKSPKGKKITFSYEEESFTTPIMLTEPLLIISEIEKYQYISAYNTETIHYFNYSYSLMDQPRLKKIEFEQGNVTFSTSDRNDLTPLKDGDKTQKLEIMEIKNNNNDIIKRLKFDYYYMGNSNDPHNCRLMLNTISEEINNQKKQKYTFSYIEGTLPKKNSFATDPWGHYNGELKYTSGIGYSETIGNTFRTLSPVLKDAPISTVSTYINPNRYPIAKMKSGKNIKPDIDSMKVGTLETIEYPTGGKTKFIYEPHEFQYSFPAYTGQTSVGNTVRIDFFTNPNANKNQTIFWGEEFTVSKAGYITIQGGHHPEDVGLTPPETSVAITLIKRKDAASGQEISEEVLNFIYRCFSKNEPLENNSSLNNLFYIQPGTYQIRVNREAGDFKYRFWADAFTIDREYFSYGGGLRIKEIHNIENDKLLTKKRYIYKEKGINTGHLLAWPDFANIAIYDRNTVDPTIPGDPGSLAWRDNFITSNNLLEAANTTPYTSLVGTNAEIAYSYVEEYAEDSQGKTNGKTTYRFFSEMATRVLLPGFPVIAHPGNGSLLEMCDYDNRGNLIKKTNKYYALKKGQIDQPVKGLITHYTDELLVTGPNDHFPWRIEYFGAKYYDLPSERWELNKERIAEYALNSSDSIVIETSYQYHSTYWMQNNIQTTGSRGEKLEQKIKFPGDYTDNISKKMVTNNMVALPIEATDLVGGSITSVSKTLYCDTLGMILPKLSYTSNTLISPTLTNYGQYMHQFKDLIIYDLYDVKGNPLQIKGKDLIPVSYVWAYNGMYPIIEATNIEYAKLRALIGTSLLNPLLTQNDLTQANITELRNRIENHVADKALVNFYTYKPLVGLLTATNPLGTITGYEYDIFGRLTCIYEKKNESDTKKILQTFNYNYKKK